MTNSFALSKNAIEIFEKRFQEKTGINWVDRNCFDDYMGRYTMDSKYINFYSLKNETESEEEEDELSEDNSGDEVLAEAKKILKNVCFEILVNNNKDQDFFNENSTKLFDLIPTAFEKKVILNSTDSIIKARIALNDYEKNREGED